LTAAALLLVCASSWADTELLPLTDDAFVAGDVDIWQQADNNYGADSNLFVHAYGPKQSLLRFDAASISGQTVTNATLRLYLNDIRSAGTISVHAITSSWNEGSVTWNNRPPAEGSAAAVVNVTTSDEGSVISIDVTNVVARWAAGSLPDAGFLLVTANYIRAFFDAKEKSGGTSATLEVDIDSGPVFTGEAIVLDLSNPDNCVIDEPGHYILDRSWNFYYPYDGCRTVDSPEDRDGRRILISADDVTLDFRGFEIEDEDLVYGHTIRVTGSNVTLLNSSGVTGVDCIEGQGTAIVAMQDASNVRLDNMRNIHCVSILGSGGKVVNSAISYLRLIGDRNVVEYSTINGTVTVGSASSVRFNRIFSGMRGGGEIWVNGDGNVIQGNFNAETDLGIRVRGAGNIIKDNILLSAFDDGAGIWIDGNANIVDANIVLPMFDDGIFFTGTGNFFGNNRVSAATPFSGTAGQIDWGGNVSY
jgi:hypothetical protein